MFRPRLPCRLFLTVLLCGTGLASPAFRVAAGETLLLAQGQRQLFVDDAGIEQQIGVERRFYPPRALSDRPILTRAFRGFIYPDPSAGYRLYYTSGPIRPGTDQLFTIRMAQSRDGLAWEVPDLNVMEFDPEYEEERNNVLLEDAILEGLFVEKTLGRTVWKAVVLDRRQRPAESGPRTGVPALYTADDGIHWKHAADLQVPSSTITGNGSGGPVVWFAPIARFLDCGRGLESQDLLRWSAARPELKPAARAPGAGGFTFQYEGKWLEWIDSGNGGSIRPAGQGGSNPGAAASGSAGFWTGLTGLHTTGAPVVAGEELRFYRVRALSPAPASAEEFVTELFSLRRDGFAALQSGDAPGRVVTRPLVLGSGSTLWINGDAAPGGGVKAALLGADGKEVPGFEFNRSVPVTAGGTRVQLTWSGPSRPALPTRPVRLAFELNRAALYAFWIE